MSEEASIRSLAGDFGWDKLCRSLLRFWEKRGLEFPVFLFSVLICRCFFLSDEGAWTSICGSGSRCCRGSGWVPAPMTCLHVYDKRGTEYA
jgi:hypothetical protein